MIKNLKRTSIITVLLCTAMFISNFRVMAVEKTTSLYSDYDNLVETGRISNSYEKVYYDEKIHIHNLNQLKAIGTNQKVKDLDETKENFGLGKDIVVDDQTITYSLDATYILENDIALNGEKWNDQNRHV